MSYSVEDFLYMAGKTNLSVSEFSKLAPMHTCMEIAFRNMNPISSALFIKHLIRTLDVVSAKPKLRLKMLY